MAIRLERPTAALMAIELKLKLRGFIHDRRFSLYTDSPDDDLSTCLFDPREDEDPPLEDPSAENPPEAPLPPAETPLPAQPTAASAPAKPAPILRIPPVPPRALEAFGIDPKDFPTVCPAEPDGPRSP
jgi:hypothetical protein